MKINEKINCPDFPCKDVDTRSYTLPDRDIHVENTRIIMITEAPPDDRADYFYSRGNPFYLQTTLQAFRDAGADVASMVDILDLGVYITTAIKCGKTQYAVSSETMQNCSRLLEQEIVLFPDVKAYMLMGDVAIKMMNGIFKKQTGKSVIPAGSTYKIRGQSYYWEGKRVFPSYTPAGKNFLIEKSKRRMVAEDIKEAFKYLAL
jgi:uracil-DNA glycosylase